MANRAEELAEAAADLALAAAEVVLLGPRVGWLLKPEEMKMLEEIRSDPTSTVRMRHLLVTYPEVKTLRDNKCPSVLDVYRGRDQPLYNR